MKKVFLNFCFCSSILWSFSQVGIGNTNPDASSILDITATDKGILLPRVSLNNVTTTLLDGSNTAATGLFIYNTNAGVTGGNGVGYYYFNGTIWEKITTSATNDDDNDWHEEGTTTSPDNINDDMFTFGNVAIGKNTADYPIDISITGSRGVNIIDNGVYAGALYGTYIENSNSGNGTHYGLYGILSGTGTGQQLGSYHGISNTGNSAHYGVYNDLSGVGSGNQYGTRNLITNTGDGFHYGVYNGLSGTGDGDQFGIRSIVANLGNGIHYGVHNWLTGTGIGDQFGSYQEISNYGSGTHYGSYNDLSGSGTGPQYGAYNYITNSGNSSHYGTYNTLTGNGLGQQFGTTNSVSSNVLNSGNVGTFNSLSGIGTTQLWGTLNMFGSFGDGLIIGTKTEINNAGNGIHYGTQNILSGNGSNEQYGILNAIYNSMNNLHYGSYNILNGDGSGIHYGAYNELSGVGTGEQYGIYNEITNTGNGGHTGIYSVLSGTGTGVQIGFRSEISNNGNSAHYGFFNSIDGSGDGTHTGNFNAVGGAGTGIHTGIATYLGGIGTGTQYGTSNTISNSGNNPHYGSWNELSGEGSGRHYGTYNVLTGFGTGDKFGVYNYIPSTAFGTHYGVYSEATKSGSYAGYFLGRVSIGSGGLGNNYILPESRGGANQIIQTDGSGNLDWVNTSTIGDDLGNHSATTTLDLNSNQINEVLKINMLPQSNYDKYRLYNNSITTIGMHDNMTYGFLNNDWAMTFTVQEDADRGWIWRDLNDAQSDGAMSLTADGRMTLKSHLRVDTNTLTVDATNNRVGIGTIAPVDRFHVNGGRVEFTGTTDASGTAGSGVLEVANALRLDANEVITNTNTTLYIQNDNNGDLRVDASTLVVDASVNRVGIRTTTPDFDLNIKQSSNTAGGAGGLGLTSNSSTNDWKIYHSGTSLYFAENGINRARINTGTGQYFQLSDLRLKKEITALPNVLSKLNNLSVYNYLYEDQSSTSKRTLGFMAQDVLPLFPELVSKGEDGYLGLNYSGFGVIAIKAIQEQQDIIENQNTKIEILEQKLQQQQFEINEIKALLKNQ